MTKYILAGKQRETSQLTPISETVILAGAEREANRIFEEEGFDEVVVAEFEATSHSVKAIGMPYRRVRNCKHGDLQQELQEDGTLRFVCLTCNARVGKAIKIALPKPIPDSPTSIIENTEGGLK